MTDGNGYKLDNVRCSERLRDLRTSRGLSHISLGRAIQVSEQSLKDYEQAFLKYGQSNNTTSRVNAIAGMKIETLYSLARYFDVSADYLLGLSDAESSNMEIKGVAETTGMSSKAVEALISMLSPDNALSFSSDREGANIFNLLLESGQMEMFILALWNLSIKVDELREISACLSNSGIKTMDDLSKLNVAEREVKIAQFDLSERVKKMSDYLFETEDLLRTCDTLCLEGISRIHGQEVR